MFLLGWLLTVPPAPVTLTIDDGPDYRYHDRMLDALKKHQRKVVFFVLGAMLQDKRNRVLLRRIVSEGHQLGNHLYTHLSPCQPITDRRGRRRKSLGPYGTLREAKRTEQAIQRVLGRPHKMKYWRAPFGHTCRSVSAVMRKRGYTHMAWHVDDIDSSLARFKRVVFRRKARRKPTIVLFHYHVRRFRRFLTFLSR